MLTFSNWCIVLFVIITIVLAFFLYRIIKFARDLDSKEKIVIAIICAIICCMLLPNLVSFCKATIKLKSINTYRKSDVNLLSYKEHAGESTENIGKYDICDVTSHEVKIPLTRFIKAISTRENTEELYKLEAENIQELTRVVHIKGKVTKGASADNIKVFIDNYSFTGPEAANLVYYDNGADVEFDVTYDSSKSDGFNFSENYIINVTNVG